MLTDPLNNLTIFSFTALIVLIVEEKSIKVESPNNLENPCSQKGGID